MMHKLPAWGVIAFVAAAPASAQIVARPQPVGPVTLRNSPISESRVKVTFPSPLTPQARSAAVQQLTGNSAASASETSVRYGPPNVVPAGGGLKFANITGWWAGADTVDIAYNGGIRFIVAPSGAPVAEGYRLFDCAVSLGNGKAVLRWFGYSRKTEQPIGATIPTSGGRAVFVLDMSTLRQGTFYLESDVNWTFSHCDVTGVK